MIKKFNELFEGEVLKYNFSDKEIKDFEQEIIKYEKLLQKELNMKDLMNVDKITQYVTTLKSLYEKVANGYYIISDPQKVAFLKKHKKSNVELVNV